ncbi:hypothetical protein PCANC_03949 [Puccinia coronata f. sp. avenae]|uniref:Uncharacterized protein n=1 Tax=Puccinia coronata f. sp. avenae TaxID=200324 RepID=A0A2N5W1G8_9BASI|nr:hypothetical protein PCANC_03949 [Puccinia coronata f. sp. avenae]
MAPSGPPPPSWEWMLMFREGNLAHSWHPVTQLGQECETPAGRAMPPGREKGLCSILTQVGQFLGSETGGWNSDRHHQKKPKIRPRKAQGSASLMERCPAIPHRRCTSTSTPLRMKWANLDGGGQRLKKLQPTRKNKLLHIAHRTSFPQTMESSPDEITPLYRARRKSRPDFCPDRIPTEIHPVGRLAGWSSSASIGKPILKSMSLIGNTNTPKEDPHTTLHI